MKERFLLGFRQETGDKDGMISRCLRVVILLGTAGLATLAVRPYHDGVLHYGLPLSAFFVWVAALWLLWRRAGVRMLLLAVPMLLTLPFFLPGRPLDPELLKGRYLKALQRLQGTAYLWGGESRRGIDCSGLPRRALRDALLETGLKTGNGNAFREWAEQWWFDTSARALGENYRGFTRPLGLVGKLRDLDTSDLSAGDLAVTSDGRHVLVYLGDGRWIQADPASAKVFTGDPQKVENAYYHAHVKMHRWMLLE
ncbi:MAG: hypothetical protein EOP85_02305 [Verrucomicrobiaceae bacterium]|nr:MAG: hypothetical protein EOP85_02305 [Verrucomicrobiaceae bacterium]